MIKQTIQTHYIKIRDKSPQCKPNIRINFVHNVERKSSLRKHRLPGKYLYRSYIKFGLYWMVKKIPSMHLSEILEEAEEQLIFVQIRKTSITFLCELYKKNWDWVSSPQSKAGKHCIPQRDQKVGLPFSGILNLMLWFQLKTIMAKNNFSLFRSGYCNVKTK